MHLTNYLEMQRSAETSLGDAYRQVARTHHDDAELYYLVLYLADQCDRHATALEPVIAHHGDAPEPAPERLLLPGFDGVRAGRAGLLRDLQEIYTAGCLVDITWTILRQGAQGARDRELLGVVEACAAETSGQLAALKTVISSTAPQALLVAP